MTNNDQGSLYGDGERACQSCGSPLVPADVAYCEQCRRVIGRASGEHLRDLALKVVDENADEAWKQLANQTIYALACEREFLTSDDVWARIGSTRENRAMGPRMLFAQRRGWIEKAGWTKCTRPSRHGTNIQRWRSRIFQPKAEVTE